MVFWLFLIFLAGASLTFAPHFMAEYNLVWCFGLVVMFISVGLGIRTENLRRKATREKLVSRVKELERQCSIRDGGNSPGKNG